MFTEIRRAGQKAVLVGDLNAKAYTWGSPITDIRAEILGEWLASQDMVIINDGGLPTCVTPNGCSYIDVTAAAGNLVRSISGWRVHLEETLSTHRYISFNITGLRGAGRKEKEKAPLDIKRCTEVIREKGVKPLDQCLSLEDLTVYLRRIRDVVASRRPVARKTPYWWTDEIEATWRDCNAARRTAIRALRNQHQRLELLEQQYRVAKMSLTRIRCVEGWVQACKEGVKGSPPIRSTDP